MNVNFRNFAIWLVILFMLMGLFQVFQSTTRNVSVTDKSFTEFTSAVDAGSVTSVTIVDNVVQGILKDGSRFETVIPPNTDIVTRLEDRGVNITAKEPESSPFWSILLSSWLPFLVIIGVWFFFIRQMQGGGRGGAMGFGKSREDSRRSDGELPSPRGQSHLRCSRPDGAGIFLPLYACRWSGQLRIRRWGSACGNAIHGSPHDCAFGSTSRRHR